MTKCSYDMKTIYECPQSKGIRVSTVLAFLFVFAALNIISDDEGIGIRTLIRTIRLKSATD